MCFELPDLTPKQNLLLQGTTVFSKALTGFAGASAARDEKNARADILDLRASEIERIGSIEERERLKLGKRQVGTQRAVLASRNLDLTTGTPAKITEGTRLMAEIDALTIRDETRRGAEFARFGADVQRFGAKQISPFLEGTAPLLSGSASLLRQESKRRKALTGSA